MAKPPKAFTFAPDNPCIVAKNIFITLLLGFFFAGCGPKVIHDQKIELNDVWSYTDHYDFSFDVTDTMPAYDIILKVEHDKFFPYQNIYTKVNTRFPNDKDAEHVISLNLTDKQNQWVGDCGSKHCTAELVLSENIYFNQPGKYVISLKQYGRTDSLAGVQSLQLLVQETEKQ